MGRAGAELGAPDRAHQNADAGGRDAAADVATSRADRSTGGYGDAVSATPSATGTATVPATPSPTPGPASPTADEGEPDDEAPGPTASPTQGAEPADDGGVSPLLLVGMGLVVVGLIALAVWRWRG